jgi:peptidoglycan/xylan/chitin deacetylase (PgdA/CDA1 family)
MTALETAFAGILGFYPTYMRAPFLEHSPAVLDTMAELGYHVIGASIDTKDYENDDAHTNWRSFEKFLDGLEAGGSVVLAHDSHWATVEILVDNMLAEIGRRGLSGEFCILDSDLIWAVGLICASCDYWGVPRG